MLAATFNGENIFPSYLTRLLILLHVSGALKANLDQLFALPFPFTLIFPRGFIFFFFS